MATEQYITMPVTSTSVATKGAEDVAGSCFSFFRMIGSIEPIKLPHIITPINAKKIIVAICIQCGP